MKATFDISSQRKTTRNNALVKAIMKEQNVKDLVAYLFIALFLYTAQDKIIEHARFLKALSKSYLIGPHLALPISILVPFAEIATAVLLIIPPTRYIYGLFSALALMLSFTVYIQWMLSLHKPLTCRCAGFIDKMTWPQHLFFNLLLCLLALIALLPLRQIATGTGGKLKRRHKYSIHNLEM